MSQLYTGNLRKADLDFASSGDNTIISAPSTGYIVIDFICIMPTSAVTIQLKDGTTAYGGPLPLDAKQVINWENTYHSDQGIITLSPGNAFNINLGGAVQIGGFCRYRVIN